MQTPSTDNPERPPPSSTLPKKRSWRRIAKMVLLTFIVLVAAATLLPSPRLPQGILTATADEHAASGYRQEGEIAGGSLTASAVKLQSNRNTMASLATTNSGGARVFDRALVLFNLSDDVLMRRVGLQLFEQLRDAGRFTQIRYLPAGELLPQGEPLPEVFVTLDLKLWEESGLPGNKEFKGKLVVTASDQFRPSSNSYQDHLTPPQVQYRWKVDLDYQAKQTGIETSGTHYQAVSRELVDEIAKSLTKMLDDLATKHGRAGTLPQQFYPPYSPPPEFDFLTKFDAQKLIDGSGFMRSNLTVWQTPDDQSPPALIAALRDALGESGWRVSGGGEHRAYLRIDKANEIITVFRENDGTYLPNDIDAPARMFIVYTRSMSTDDLDGALQKLLADGTDESMLVLFQDAWYRQRERVEEHFPRPPAHRPRQLENARPTPQEK